MTPKITRASLTRPSSEKHHGLSVGELDKVDNPREEMSEFNRMVEAAFTRRDFLARLMAFGTAAFLTSVGSGCSTQRVSPKIAMGSDTFDFKAIAVNAFDTVTVPEGYDWYVLGSWGDPLWEDAASFDESTRGTGASQECALGDNNDGMDIFVKNNHVIFAVNNEYTNLKILHGNRKSKGPKNADDVRKAKAAHGVSIFEIAKKNGSWQIVKDSRYNRRITADSLMEITGPARGHDLLKTDADQSGTSSLGTWSNCGSGKTPWGTYLACEENFNGYFSSSDGYFQPTSQMERYGIDGKDGWGYGWGEVDERFDISRHPNEPNRAGYVVEIDPFDPESTPKKRTALGRFKHENAEVAIAEDGRVVVYSGDDERGEFIYRFVSEKKYREGGDNMDLLESGTLYAAKFEDDGTGRWLALTPEAAKMRSLAEVCIFTRIAASKAGATTMDRPEWIASDPAQSEVYCALTNNEGRGICPNAGGDKTPVGGPNPRKANLYGQIVRWKPDGGDHAAEKFRWDLFVLAGNPKVHSDDKAGSENVTADNMFNSPDGIHFDTRGRLWIQTDGDYSNEGNFDGHGNNQMLVGDTKTGEIRRFLVGPNECEITGLTWSPDKKTIFIGVQHPGADGGSHFPNGGNSVPRSSVIAIHKKDGNDIV